MDSNITIAWMNQYEIADSSWLSHIWANCWVTIIFSIIALSLTTRLFSGPLSPPQEVEYEATPVPRVPYWFPILGHLPNLLLAPSNLMDWARTTYSGGAFALNLGGTTHSFIFHPTLGTALLGQRNGAADSHSVFRYIMCATFGFPKREIGKYDDTLSEITACYRHLLSEPSLGIMVQKTVDVLKENISNFVTFSSSIVDQTQWERTSGVDIVTNADGERVVETSLL